MTLDELIAGLQELREKNPEAGAVPVCVYDEDMGMAELLFTPEVRTGYYNAENDTRWNISHGPFIDFSY